MNNLKVSKKDVKKSYAEKALKREAQAKHNEVMRTFDKGIATHEHNAKLAFNEAIKATKEGRKEIAKNYLKLYIANKDRIDYITLKKSEYSIAVGGNEIAQLSKQIMESMNAAILALGCPKPEKVFAEQNKNDKKLQECIDAYNVIMERLQENTQNITSDIDEIKLEAAEDEVKTAIDLERANKLSDSVFPDIKTNDFSTEELLMAIEEKNKEE